MLASDFVPKSLLTYYTLRITPNLHKCKGLG